MVAPFFYHDSVVMVIIIVLVILVLDACRLILADVVKEGFEALIHIWYLVADIVLVLSGRVETIQFLFFL